MFKKYKDFINESRSLSRDEMIIFLKKYLKKVNKSEDVSDFEGGIVCSAENGDRYKGYAIFDYYNESDLYDLGVYVEFGKMLQERGWYAEFEDPGTVIIALD